MIALQIIFIVITIIAIWLFSKKTGRIRRNILSGRDEDLTDNKNQRWRNVLLLAFGQKKMFRNPLVAVMHFIIMQASSSSTLKCWKLLLTACWAPTGSLHHHWVLFIPG
jgi:hypothetical protein